jgi:hypothetical protein
VIVDWKTLDERALAEMLQKTAQNVWERFPQADWAHRTVDELAPQSLKPWKE